MTVSKGSDAIEKSAGVKGREREKEGDRKRGGGGVQKELWSCRTKKKKSKILSQTTRVLTLFGRIQDRRDRERERDQYVFKNTLHQGGTVL